MPLRALVFALPVLGLSGCRPAPIAPEAVEHNTAGAELLAEGDLERAEARFRLALEFAPSLAEARANLGLVALRREHYREAEAHLRGAIGLRGDFGEAWGNLGVVLERLDRDEEAEAAYARALAIHPGLRAPRRNLAYLLVRHGRADEARAHLLRLSELDPDDVEAAGLLAWCELRLGRPEAALEIAEAALERDPEARAPRLVRGALRAASGALDEALQDLEPLRDDPDLGREAAVRIAAIWAVLGRTEDALGLAEELVRAHDEPAARLVAASAARQGAAWDRARTHALAALQVDPGLEAALLVLAEACVRLSDPRCAAEALGRVRSTDGATAREAARLRAALH